MGRTFRDTLKKITPLRKSVLFIRRITYPKYRKLYDGLSDELNAARAENAALKGEISLLGERVAALSGNIGGFEQSQHRENLFVRNRLNAFNTAANIILYESELDRLPADESFMPKVSLIIPVYNGEKYLQNALDCAFSQTYPNIEIIAVNDGSTDGTDGILASYGDRIKYIRKENGGVSSALNAGINAMTGDYFAWLSHDDLIDGDHIEKLVGYLKRHRGEKVIPYSAFKFADKDGKLLAEDTVNAKLAAFDYKTSLVDKYAPLLFGEINGGSVLIPKEAFDKFGVFDEKKRITQERDMWARLIKEYRFVCIPYDTATIRIHTGQVSEEREKVARESDIERIEIAGDIYRILKAENPQKAEEMRAYLKLHYYCNSNDALYNSLKENEE